MSASDFIDLKLAEALAEGATLGWFSGPMEFGARALGARSILADPRNQSMSDTLNKAIKQRESFRPFAPIVIESEAQRYFEIETSSPFMTEVFKVHDDVVLPGITHVNGTARVQTITKKCHPQIMKLMEAFYVLTGCPILINTSFNLKDEPIVCTPEDAIACFILSGLDILYLEGILLYKKNLPADYRDNVKAFYEFVEKSRSIHIHQQAYSLL